MSGHKFFQIDAFTTTPLGGNPCAIVFDADDLCDKQMQAIAKEMNLSETVFVLKPSRSDFKARYFTPSEEIPLATNAGDTFARHFGVPPDTYEDPFTGSATGNMACYLWRHQLIDRPQFVAEQGHWMDRPGIAEVEVIGKPDSIESVKLTGTAVTVLSGTLQL